MIIYNPRFTWLKPYLWKKLEKIRYERDRTDGSDWRNIRGFSLKFLSLENKKYRYKADII